MSHDNYQQQPSYCQNCGHQLFGDEMFCSNCGQTVSSRAMPQAPPQVAPTYGVPGGLVSNLKLILTLVRRKRGSIYNPSAEVFQRLPTETMARSRRYLNFAVLSLIVGLATILVLTASENVSAFIIPAFFAALVPAIAYFAYFYRIDRLEPEPLWFVALAFGWGAASLLPSLILNTTIAPSFGGWMGFAALVEEPFKILGIYLIMRNRWLKNEVNDHLDGLLYGAAAGLGFSFGENILYISRGLAGDMLLIIPLRAATMVMHMFATALIGWWMGYLKTNHKPINIGNIVPGLLLAIGLHMFWNTTAVIEVVGLGIVVVVTPVLLYLLNKMAKEALLDERYWGFATGNAPIEPKKIT